MLPIQNQARNISTPPWEVIQQKTLSIFLVLCFFALPLGNSLKSIFLSITLVLIVLSPNFFKNLIKTIKTPYVYAIFGFYGYVILASFWSPANTHDVMFILEKYSKLFYLPILAVGFIDKDIRQSCLNAFLCAMLITCILSILSSYGMHLLKSNSDPGHVFYNHIITGILVAFSAYLAFYWAKISRVRWKRNFCLSIGILFSYQILFINTGKTGYIIYFGLMILLFFQIISAKKAFLACGILLIFAALIYANSPVMHHQIKGLINETQQYKIDKKDTSFGYRMQFHNYAKSLFVLHPILGNGTGAFAYHFHEDNPIPSWGDDYFEPHSQYWLIACEQGSVGIALFLIFLGSMAYLSFQSSQNRVVLLGLLLVFSLVSCSDSILLVSPLGLLLILFSASCLGDHIHKKS